MDLNDLELLIHECMDLNDLELLMSVARLGSFAAAARERNVDPSSVSRVVAGLEAEFGVRLFQRSTRQLVLTEAGADYTQRLGPLLEEMHQARLALVDAGEQVRGKLRVSVSNTFGLRRVAPFLPAFCARHPRLDVELMLTDAMVDLVADRVDVAVRLGALKDSSLVAVPLMPVQYRVVASPGWLRAQSSAPQSPADLAQVECVSFALPGFRDRWLFRPSDGGGSMQVPIRARVQTSNGLALREFVLAGMGPALLPHWLIDEDLLAGNLLNLFPDHEVGVTDAPAGAWLVYPSRSHVPAKVRLFIDFLKDAVASCPRPADCRSGDRTA
ncbi:LysR family transcriptional regulator [Sphaerotilus uruguayifluvii]|uniref:DNA-binding transcriptional LysR family regulator n=1 Tax=Sphaerotilus uruguayifluvii TaxID=2735897 RepID=A0ABX2G5C7_9BURK|nr:LysR family transcriptional regulator [Leptothrix sp. C29]NRT56607.1 DNA-binding transcriptional LysR family regulator [Leptothrix sp. C29]